jgi:hypothetical protein
VASTSVACWSMTAHVFSLVNPVTDHLVRALFPRP